VVVHSRAAAALSIARSLVRPVDHSPLNLLHF